MVEGKAIHVLAEAFRCLAEPGVKLVIAGASLPENETYVARLREILRGTNAEFRLNPPRRELERLYAESLIFWHAMGYGVDEQADPISLEHFGMSTVEAMSARCIPIAINKGGQREIVDDGVNGFTWDTPDELIEKTRVVLRLADHALLQQNARRKSEEYGTEAFGKRLASFLAEDELRPI